MKAIPLKVLLIHRKKLREDGKDLLEIDTLIAEMVKAVDYRIGLYTVHPEGVRYTMEHKVRILLDKI